MQYTALDSSSVMREINPYGNKPYRGARQPKVTVLPLSAEENVCPQMRFNGKKTITTGTMPANQMNGSPVIGTSPCSCGIAQLSEVLTR